MWVRFEFLLGSEDFLCAFVCPSRPDPCSHLFWIPLSSFVVWMFFFCSPSSRLSFSLFSQALGNHKPRGGLWFPLCSLRPGHGHRLRPVLLRLQLHLGQRPAPVFLVSLSASRSLSRSLSLSLSGVGRPGCACRHNRTDGGGLQDGAPNYYHDGFLLASFWGKSIGQCPGQSALNCRCSPHFLPQSPKVGAGRGSGGGNRIVTQMRSLGIGPVLSHIFGFALPRFEGGNAVHFFFAFFFGLVLVLCRFLAKFSSSKGLFAQNFRERTFVFALFLSPCVFDRDLPMVFAHFLAISPRKCFRKILFMSGLVFCCLVLSVLGSGLTTSFVLSLFSLSFSFERQSSGLTGHHTPPRTCCCFSCFFPCRFVLFRLFWPCVPFCFWRFFGVPFWAPRGFWILSGLF